MGCSFRQIFAEIFIVHGSTDTSCDTVCRWKKKFDSGLVDKNASKSGRLKSAFCEEII